jgi:hypothetical protein
MIGVDSIEPNTPPLLIVIRAAGQFLDGQLAFLRALAEIGDPLLDVGDGQLVRVAQDRHDEPARTADGDADVVVAVIDDVVPVDRRVDEREFLQRMHDRLHEEAHEAELDAVLLLEALLVAVAQLDHRLHVHFVERRQDCRRRLRLRRVAPAIRARSRDIGTRCSGRLPCIEGNCTAAQVLRWARAGMTPACRRSGHGGGFATFRRGRSPRAPIASATSPFVMRPPRPVPATLAGSTPLSAIILRAEGSAVTGWLVGGGVDAEDAGLTGAAAVVATGAVAALAAGAPAAPRLAVGFDHRDDIVEPYRRSVGC